MATTDTTSTTTAVLQDIGAQCPSTLMLLDATLSLRQQLTEPPNTGVFSNELICEWEGSGDRFVANRERPSANAERRFTEFPGNDDCSVCGSELGDVPFKVHVQATSVETDRGRIRETVLTTLVDRRICTARHEGLRATEAPPEQLVQALIELNRAICTSTLPPNSQTDSPPDAAAGTDEALAVAFVEAVMTKADPSAFVRDPAVAEDAATGMPDAEYHGPYGIRIFPGDLPESETPGECYTYGDISLACPVEIQRPGLDAPDASSLVEIYVSRIDPDSTPDAPREVDPYVIGWSFYAA